jgi:hypothetical protein
MGWSIRCSRRWSSSRWFILGEGMGEGGLDIPIHGFFFAL